MEFITTPILGQTSWNYPFRSLSDSLDRQESQASVLGPGLRHDVFEMPILGILN